MSRLDSAIRRLMAQRACLDHLAELIAGVSGPVFELGLGNGRTFDHLREHMADREIFVFEREMRAHPDCIPDADHLFKGDFADSFLAARARFEGKVALIHADIGSGDATENAGRGKFIADHAVPFLKPGGAIACDQNLDGTARLQRLSLPDGVQKGRYHLYLAATDPAHVRVG